MAALPPLRARARALLLATLATAAVGAGLGYLVHVWPAPEPLRVPFREPVVDAVYTPDAYDGHLGYFYIPPRDRRCLRTLDAWMRTTDWQLVIRLDARVDDRFATVLTITSTGHATFSHDGEARAVFLGPLMLERLHRMSDAGCIGAPSGYVRMLVRLGTAADAPTLQIHDGSAAYERLMRFIADAAVSTEPIPTPLRLPEP